MALAKGSTHTDLTCYATSAPSLASTCSGSQQLMTSSCRMSTPGRCCDWHSGMSPESMASLRLQHHASVCAFRSTRPGISRVIVWCKAGKGFGKGKKAQQDDNDDVYMPANKTAVKRVRAPPANGSSSPMPQSMPGGLSELQLRRVEDLEKQMRQAQEDHDFMRRLELIKLEAKEKAAAALPQSSPPANGTPPATSARQNPLPNSPQQPAEDIYANPPSLTDTLLTQLNPDISDPALRDAKIGPGQVGLAAGAVVLGLLILITSAGDFTGGRNRYKNLRPSKAAPTGQEASLLMARAAALEDRLEANPDDLVSLESLAVTYAKMYKFDKAADLLDKLVSSHTDDFEAWRLLGETNLLSARPQRAIAAYEKAVALDANDQQVLTGLVDAYIADGKFTKAVAQLRGRLAANPIPPPAVASTAAAASSSSSSDRSSTSPPDAASTDAAQTAPAVVAAVAAEPNQVTGTASDEAAASSEQAVAEAAATTAATTSIEPATAAQGPSTTAEAAAESSSGSSTSSSGQRAAKRLDPVAVQLLLGKTYAAWRGHDTDALGAYDQLIGDHPQDFRGYLAKGVFLKERGRHADADRMFIQAKFYAPLSMQAFVADRAGESPALTQLPDNGME
eukprot:jgi/Chrzof1/3743/Cz13g07090.t1